jgi:hypothetical protein
VLHKALGNPTSFNTLTLRLPYFGECSVKEAGCTAISIFLALLWLFTGHWILNDGRLMVLDVLVTDTNSDRGFSLHSGTEFHAPALH